MEDSYYNLWKYLGKSKYKITTHIKQLQYVVEDIYTYDYIVPDKLKMVYGTQSLNDVRLKEYIDKGYIIGIMPWDNYTRELEFNKDNWEYFMPTYIVNIYE